jgi:signal transduction histidine kinase
MKWSLKQKTWIFIILFTTITIFTIVILTNYLYEQFYIENQVEQLKARGDSLEEVYYEEEENDKEEFHRFIVFMSRCAAAQIVYDDSDEVINGSIPRTIPLLDEESRLTEEEMIKFKEDETLILTRSGSEEDYLIIMNPLLNEDDLIESAIIISTPVTAAFAPFQSLRAILFVGLAIAFLVIVFVLNKVANYVINPIEKMIYASKFMSKGDFTKKIEVENKDEIGDLAASFNYMSTSLAEADLKKQEFLGNVSHELRTPLSYLKGYSEVLIEQKQKGEPLDTKYIEKIHSEGSRMESLVHDLLDLARLEGDKYPMTLAPIPFAQLVEDVVERMTLESKKRGMDIRMDLNNDAIINGDEKRMEQVVINLVENAIRYAQNGKYVDLIMDIKETNAILQVIDYGEGIPKEALEKLTERFYRVDRSRSRSSGGTGLGLTIVKEIVKKHNGSLTFESKLGKGMIVSVILPLFEE